MPVEYLPETPSQTAGPYVHIGLMPPVAGLNVRTQDRPGVLASSPDAIIIEGMVRDGTGHPVRDAVIELWQAGPSGHYNEPGFSGFGRASADFHTGLFRFETLRPGAVTERNGQLSAPHVNLLILARGINIHLHTRCYLPDNPAVLDTDPVLASLEMKERRKTLVARAEDTNRYRFDIILQGEAETVFFDA